MKQKVMCFVDDEYFMSHKPGEIAATLIEFGAPLSIDDLEGQTMIEIHGDFRYYHEFNTRQFIYYWERRGKVGSSFVQVRIKGDGRPELWDAQVCPNYPTVL